MKNRLALLIPLALLSIGRPAIPASGNSVVIHSAPRFGVYTVVKDAAAPGGARLIAEVPATVDAELRCKRDGYRTDTLGGLTASGASVWRANVELLQATAAAAACEAGKATVAISSMPIYGRCKNVGNVLDIMADDRPHSAAVPGYAVQIKCQGFAKEQSRKPLWLMWNPTTQDNDSVPGYWPRAAPWAFVRIQGEVLKAPAPGTLPLRQYRRTDGTGDNLLTTKAAPPGYKEETIWGHIFAPGSQPPGTVPLMRYWSSARKDYYLCETSTFNAAAEGYSSPVLEGYIYKPE